MLKERIDALATKTKMNSLRSVSEWIERELNELVGMEIGYNDFSAKVSGIRKSVEKMGRKVVQNRFYFEIEGSEYLKNIFDKEYILRVFEVPEIGVVFELLGTGNFLCKFNEELFLAYMCRYLVNLLK